MVNSAFFGGIYVLEPVKIHLKFIKSRFVFIFSDYNGNQEALWEHKRL